MQSQRLSGVVLCVGVLLLICTTAAHAASITVSTLADGSLGTPARRAMR